MGFRLILPAITAINHLTSHANFVFLPSGKKTKCTAQYKKLINLKVSINLGKLKVMLKCLLKKVFKTPLLEIWSYQVVVEIMSATSLRRVRVVKARALSCILKQNTGPKGCSRR